MPTAMLLLLARFFFNSAAPIVPNDNQHAAGVLAAGVLTVHLDARAGVWLPGGAKGPSIETFAFAETGKSLQTPGPMLRVPLGTEVRATIHNALPKKMWVYGMHAKPGLGDSVAVEPGATREIRFKPSVAGSFYYVARTDTFPVSARLTEDTQLGGVIIVDSAGARPLAGERIFALTGWVTLDEKTISGIGPHPQLVFNGRAYPGNERLEATQGDSVHWRFVNISSLDHPLHLHGFYFRVDAKGDANRDTLFAAADQRMAVTEYMLPGQTMRISFVPNRSGNWIFHCHFAGHIAPYEALEADHSVMTMPMEQASNASDPEPMLHMQGLVMVLNVKPAGAAPAPAAVARKLRLIVRSKKNVYGNALGYAFVLGGTPEEKDLSVMKVPGPALELVRGDRVAITIVNQSHESAAVHWHGIELESYADGVPGLSGEGKNILPRIKPGDSLTVRFTPPRAGTFMYHSHSNEYQQISSGLYGALIVRERGAARDTVNDRVMLLSDGGPASNVLDPSKFPHVRVNGELAPAPIEIHGGAARLRLINIRSDIPMTVALIDGDKPVSWRIVSKDGMPSNASQARARAATMVIAPGETYDIEYTARAGASLTLKTEIPDVPPPTAQTTLVQIRVR